MALRELATGLGFPEGPVAMDDGSVLVVEMAAGRITRVKPDGSTQTVATPGGGPNGLAIGPDGALYVCNNGGNFEIHERDGLMIPGHTPASHKGGRIERVDLSTGKTEILYSRMRRREACRRRTISCSIATAVSGSPITAARPDRHRTHGALYYARADGSKITKVLRELLSPNGVGLSPDVKTVHYAETFPGRLWSLPLSAPGVGKPPAGFTPANFEGAYPGLAYFDSLGVQADGGVCVATISRRRHLDLLARQQEVRAHAAARSPGDEHLLGRQGHENRFHHAVLDRKARRDGMALAGTAACL